METAPKAKLHKEKEIAEPKRPADKASHHSLEGPSAAEGHVAEKRLSTPPDRVPVPVLSKHHAPDFSSPEYILNRELTWLNYNFRVLHEAEDPRTPLLERVKFVSIVSSNLDEFFMKRIGGLKQQVGAGIVELTVDGRTPQQQIDECHALVRKLEKRKRRVMLGLLDELHKSDISLTTYDQLTKGEQKRLREFYVQNIYPLVTPQATDPAHPFPFVSNLSLNLLVTLRNPDQKHPSLARVKIPVGGGIPRLLRVDDQDKYVLIESVIAHNLDLLFPEMEIMTYAMFRVTRNANTEQDEETAEDLLALIESELRDRRFAPVVRLEVAADMDAFHRGFLAAELGLDEEADVFDVPGMIGMSDLMQLTSIARPELHYPPHAPLDHPEFVTDRNIFHVVRDAGSILIHHPYQSFGTSVERFLLEASHDPKVRAIKMCLYRTSADTKVIECLIGAAQNGKQVAVVVELKARFDEAANIQWANRLEQAGIHVTYGVIGLKTHCKAILVVRQDYSGLRRYAHVGTGNYHAGTARQYSDLGFFTCDEKIGEDLTELFNYLTTGYKPKRLYHKIVPAPKALKPALLSKIDREIKKHSEKSPGLIQIKMNALEDIDVTLALYRAGQAGVQVDLIVRDTCRLRPGLPGLTENVRVISVVGRFLEHARIFYFQNGGDSEYYIGSADCMNRNLESRVEILVPVESQQHRDDMRFLLDAQLKEDPSAWEMQADGSYLKQPPRKETKPSSQQRLMQWAQERLHEATRLRKRRARGITARNLFNTD